MSLNASLDLFVTDGPTGRTIEKNVNDYLHQLQIRDDKQKTNNQCDYCTNCNM